jgi:hypothetical protein
MSNRGRPGDSAQLEKAVAALAPHLDLPPAPDLARRVRVAIEAAPLPAPRRGSGRRRALAFAVAVVVLGITATLTFSPGARRAVAGWLGIGGVRISHGAGPAPTAAPGSNLALGSRTTLADARAEVDFPIALPATPNLGEPDAVYVARVPAGGRVSLVYDAGGSLPEADETGLGMILSEFRASIGPDLAKKVAGKTGGLEITEVDGELAYWLTGPHTFYLYRDADGHIREDTLRLAGNTLLWVRDGITHRIESSLSLADVIRIAESIP